MSYTKFDGELDAPSGAAAGFVPFAGALDGEPPKKRTWGQAAADTGVQLAEGVNTIAGAVPSLVAPDSGVAGFFRDNAESWRAKQSDVLQGRANAASAAIDKAGEDGVISQVVEAAKQYSSDPALAARFVTTNLPSMIPGIGAAKLAQAAALARGASAVGAASLATTAAGGVNSVLNAGGARGEAFEDIKKTLESQGRSPEEATQIALDKSRLPAAIGGVTGFISGKTGLEGALTGKLSGKVAAAATELFGEQLEEVAPKLATNYQASEYDNRAMSKDVGRTIVETAIGSGPGAIYSGMVSTPEPKTPQQAVADIATAPDVDAAIAAASEAVNAGPKFDQIDFLVSLNEIKSKIKENSILQKLRDAGDAGTITTGDFLNALSVANNPVVRMDQRELARDQVNQIIEQLSFGTGFTMPSAQAEPAPVTGTALATQQGGELAAPIQGMQFDPNTIDGQTRFVDELPGQRAIGGPRALTGPNETAPIEPTPGQLTANTRRQDPRLIPMSRREQAYQPPQLPQTGTELTTVVNPNGKDAKTPTKSEVLSVLRANVKSAPPFTQEHLDAIHALKDAVTKDAENAISNSEAPVYLSKSGLTSVITPSAQNPGMYQVTRYNSTGAIGDSQYKTIGAAIDDNQLSSDERLDFDAANSHMGKLVDAEAKYQERKRVQNTAPGTPAQAQAAPSEAPASAGTAASAEAVPAAAGGSAPVEAAGLKKPGPGGSLMPVKADLKTAKGLEVTLQREFSGKYNATIGGEPAGSVVYTDTPSGGFRVTGIDVDPKFRRKGVASAIYDFLEKDVTGQPLAESGGQSEDGIAFRRARASKVEAAGVADANPAPNNKPSEPAHYGTGHRLLTEGGKPFKTKRAADDAKKLQSMMRVKKVAGGYVLTDKTPAQVAAQAKAAARLAAGTTGDAGIPQHAHGFMAREGGLSKSTMKDLGFDKNQRVGSMWMFKADGGMSLEQATEKLIEGGYLKEGASHSDAIDLIKKSVTNPQYTADGWDRIAQAEADARLEDHLAAQEESAQNEDFDPFESLSAEGFTTQDDELAGYSEASDPIKLEVNALIEQADSLGIDIDELRESSYEATKNGSEQDYLEHLSNAIAQAISRGNQDSGGDAGQQGNQASQAQDFLTSPTREDILAKQQAEEDAAKAKESADKAQDEADRAARIKKEIDARQAASAENFTLGQSAEDALAGQGDIFSQSLSSTENNGSGNADADSLLSNQVQKDNEQSQYGEKFTVDLGSMFGQVPYRASSPVSAPDGGAVLSTEIVHRKTKLSKADAEIYPLIDGKQVWRVSAVKNKAGGIHSKIEVMDENYGRTPSGEVVAYFKEVRGHDADVLDRFAPSVHKAAVAAYERAVQGDAPSMFDAEPAAQATAILDAAEVKGKERIDILKDVKNGAITPEEVQAAYPAKEAAKIEDSGAVLEGARKLYAKAYDAKLSEGMQMDTAANPLTKTWPEPDYAKLLEGGADPWAVAFAHAARDEIPKKPMKGWKLKGWVTKVEMLRDMANKVLSGEGAYNKANVQTKIQDRSGLGDWMNKIDMYEAVGHEHSLKDFTFSSGSYSVYGGQHFSPAKTLWAITSTDPSQQYGNWGKEWAVGETKDSALSKFKDVFERNPPKEKATKKTETKFDVYSRRGVTGTIIGKKIGKNHIDLKTFPTSKEALAYLEKNQTELETLLEAAKEVQPERRENNSPRIGADHRMGANVSTEQFRETFGFRGEQFGASMPQAERQANLNESYDALMDLAGILNIPPKALSLNGELGLAFGSRGKGGKRAAAAHYERDTTGQVTPNRVVINLTREHGAGSLAHEWFHAVDNYFARMRGEKAGMLTEKPYPNGEGVRPEMVMAFRDLMKAITSTGVMARSRNLDKKRTKDYWSTGLEMAARSFESYVIAKLHEQNAANDYLANIVPEESYLREEEYPYPKAAEMPPIREAFDKFFSTVQTKETDAGVAMFARGDGMDAFRQSLSKLNPASQQDTAAIAQVKQWVDQLSAKWENGPSIRVVSSFNDLPVPSTSDTRGLYYRGAVYVVAGRVGSKRAVGEVLAHESVAHYGLREMLGQDDWKRFMGNVQMAIKSGNKPLNAIRDQIRSVYVDENGKPNLTEIQEADEIAAKAVEMAIDPKTGEFNPGFGFLKSVFAKVAQFLRDMGFEVQFTNLELQGALINAQRYLEAGQRTAGVGQMVVAAAREDAQAARSPIQSNTWNSPSTSKFDNIVYTLQNKQIDTKRVVEAIKQAGKDVAESVDVYLREELFHGRSAKRTEDFLNNELTPLLNDMKARGISLDQIDKYLHARHAEEANKVIASRNPDMPDGGSGMKTQEAKDYLNSLGAAERNRLDAVAKKIDGMIATTRQLYADEGLESQDTVDSWGAMFKHYVPLMREDKDGGMGIGQGFSIKGKESKGRVGSSRAVVDILANIAMQREKVIVRGEKNRVATALVGLATENPNPDFWTVGETPHEKVYDPKTNSVVDRIDPMYKSRENVVVAKVKQPDGNINEVAVVFNEDNDRAVRMAASLKNLDALQLNGLLGVSAKISRYISSINTQYNPIFGIVNLARDVQGAMVNLSTTELKGQQKEVSKHVLSALKGVYLDARAVREGKTASSKWAALNEEFQNLGGQTGYRDLFSTSEDRAKALQNELMPYAWMDGTLGKIFTANGSLKVPMSVAQDKAKGLFDWLSDYNLAMENAVRLSAFKVGIDQGMSKERAASLAKNLTVNFNRKGQISQQAGALYAFFNAGVQGTARLSQVLFEMDGSDHRTIRLSATGKNVVAGGIMLGVAQAVMLAAAGFGDDDPPEFVRERNLIIPTGWTGATGDKAYITIPMPLGLHVLPNIGRVSTEFALGGFRDPVKRAAKLFGLFTDAFNPMGGGASLLQILSPTPIDPLVALAENKDGMGRTIAKTSRNPAVPGFTLAKDTASKPAKMIAEAINYLSGGTEYKAGVLSPTPDQVDFLIGQATGGVGREISKGLQTASAVYTGEELPTHKIPLVGRFYGDSDLQSAQSNAFYSAVKRIEEHELEIKGLRKDGKSAELAEYMSENPEARLVPMANRVELQIQNLQKRKRELMKNDADAAQIKAVENQITERMKVFNMVVRNLREKQPA